MMNYIHIPLHDHEERYGVFRSSWWHIAPQIIFGILLTLAPFILFFPILRLEWYGLVLLFVIGIFGLRYLLSVRASWYGSALVVTSERVVDVTKKGFREPIITSVGLAEIKAVRVGSRAIWIEVKTEPKLVLELFGVKKPALVMSLINEVQSSYVKR